MNDRTYKVVLIGIFVAGAVGLAGVGERDGAGLAFLVALALLVVT